MCVDCRQESMAKRQNRRLSDCCMQKTSCDLSSGFERRSTILTHHFSRRSLSNPMPGSHSLWVSGTFEVLESSTSLLLLSWRGLPPPPLPKLRSVFLMCDTVSMCAWSPALSKERRERPQDRPEDLDVPPALADFIHQQRTQQVEQDM
jgi:hypothetical protein